MKSLYLLTFLCCISLCVSMYVHRKSSKTSEGHQANEIATGCICSLPLEIGVCRALFFRYGFDPAKSQCVEFMYGGCQGNANNFKTLEECTKACPGV